MKKKIDTQICYECGESVKRRTKGGKFCNRIPSLDSYGTRKEMNVPFPRGEWLCWECDFKRRGDHDA